MSVFVLTSPPDPAASAPVAQWKTGPVAGLSWSTASAIDVERAGRAYWSFLQRGRALDSKKLENISAIRIARGDDDEDPAGAVTFSLRDDIKADMLSDLTYYELLGFDKYGGGVRAEDIKMAYRKAVLKYHPDKTGSQRGEEDEVFMAVQKAFDTLSDSTKRRAYDSSLEFDDDIPAEDEGKAAEGEDSFFEVYGPVFERNTRFAVILPAPELGDDDTPFVEVNKFYEYWINFESWRDFTLEGEHDLEDAQDRYEKRWMIKENERKAKELKRKEYKRLSMLVERARMADPRIHRARQAEKEAKRLAKEAKEKEKQEREEAKRRAEEEERQRAEEEEARRKEEARAAKLEREKAKKELRRARKALKGRYSQAVALLAEMEGAAADCLVGEEDLEWLCQNLDMEEINCGVEALGPEENVDVSGLQVLQGLLLRAKSEAAAAEEEEEEARRREVAARAKAEARQARERKARARPWSEEELSALAKAVVRFPAGSQKRWEQIAAFIAQQLQLSDPRTKEECIAKYQELHAAPGASSKAVTKPKPAAAPTQSAAAAAAGAGGAVAAAAAAAAAVGGGGGDGGKVAAPAPPVAAAAEGSGSKAGAPAGSAEGAQDDGWTQEQQKQLEAALSKFPASMEKNERWKAIAGAVQGKNKKACVERFKFIKSQLLAKKQQAAAAK